MTDKNDYQQYFIVGNKHIGNYEQMYQNCSDPWHIEARGIRLDMKAAIMLLGETGRKFTRVLDAGSGTGLFSEHLLHHLWKQNPETQVTLTDISSTALSIAAERLSGPKSFQRDSGHNHARIDDSEPRLDYVPFDLRWLDSPLCPWPDNYFDLIVMAQVLWGLLENFNNFLKRLAQISKTGAILLITQHFPAPGTQTYGADIISGPEDLMRAVKSAGYRLINSLETDRSINHHWAGLFQWS